MDCATSRFGEISLICRLFWTRTQQLCLDLSPADGKRISGSETSLLFTAPSHHGWLGSGEFGGPALSSPWLTFTEGRISKKPANISVGPSVPRWRSFVHQTSERTQQTLKDFPSREM